MKVQVKEDPRLEESERILKDIIVTLKKDLATVTVTSEREKLIKRLKRIRKELSALNRIRRLFLLRKLRGDTVCLKLSDHSSLHSYI